jgi:hypothetical protein
MFRPVFRCILGVWPSFSALWAGAALVQSCVAQAPYEPPHAMGGSAGMTSVGIGGLQVDNPEAGGAGGAPDGSGAAVAVACRSSEQCALPFPYCSVASGTCVECLAKNNCIGTGRPYCEPNSNSCVMCLNDGQCPHATPYCATTIGNCVECLSSDNCGSSGFACDRDTFRCVPPCASNADCEGAPRTPACDPQRNLCVECVSDEACPAAAPRCASDTETCVKCVADEDCGSPFPRCDVRKHACVECVTNRDCQPGVLCVAGSCANPK